LEEKQRNGRKVESRNYWNINGLLDPRPSNECDGHDQNQLSRTAYYHLFGGKVDKQVLFVGVDAMTKDFYQTFSQHPLTTYEKDFASHDELTAVIYTLSLLGSKDNYIKYIKHWRYVFYPQVFFFLLACKYKWKWAINLAYFQMLYSTREKEKAENGKWDTDGALLSLLKIATFRNLSINKFVKDNRIFTQIYRNWGFKENLIKEMLSDYPDHPLLELVK
jgi:hypothetical protein